MKEVIFKILRPMEWEIMQKNKAFQGSDDDLRDGFIHLSMENQLEGVIAKYYTDVEKVFVLEFKAADFSDCLKWEEASNGQFYPHIYRAPLTLEKVQTVKELRL